MSHDAKPSRTLRTLGLLVVLAVLVGFSLVVFRPDRPVANIVAGSSSGPTFVVQIIRPRLGLPLGGILPPKWFGLDADLGFESTSAGATVGRCTPGRLEFSADDWSLVLVVDADGRVTAESEVVFELVFEERFRKVRCRPSGLAADTFETVTLAESGELSGSFDIELARCEDANTGEPLGWPTKPLVLHGSFDRLPMETERSEAEARDRNSKTR